MPLKIYHGLCSDRKGGLEQAFVNTTFALDKLGHEVTNLCPKSAPYSADFPTGTIHKNFRPTGFYDLWAAFKLHLRLRKHKPDLLIAHNSRAIQIFNWARTGTGIPLLGFSHGNKTKRPKKADSVVALTPNMKKLFVTAGKKPEDVFVLPNMVLHIPESPLPAPTEHDGAIKLGFMGRIAPKKGLEDLLHAVKRLRDRHVLCTLNIAGGGEDEEKIKTLASDLGVLDLLTFDGWITDIRSWFETIDLLVVPSRSEAFGIVILEAYLHGRMVVATHTDGPESQIVEGKTGFLAYPHDPKSLAGSIVKAMSGRSHWPQMISAGYKQACGHHIDHITPKLQKIIQETFSRHGRK